jgi:two-component system response regulator LytT
MTKVGILDDEVIICETLRKYLRELGYQVPNYAINYSEAITLIKTEQPDIMLLDINLNELKNGIDVAMEIRKNHNIPLIFISSNADKTTIKETVKVKPNGYLVKPFGKNDLLAAIETALSNFSDNLNQANDSDFKLLSDALYIKQNNLFVKVLLNAILYIQSDSVYAEIITKEKKYLIRESLKKLITILPEPQFFQIHRSHIVNINHIDAVNSEFAIIDNINLPISRSNREAFLKLFNLR